MARYFAPEGRRGRYFIETLRPLWVASPASVFLAYPAMYRSPRIRTTMRAPKLPPSRDAMPRPELMRVCRLQGSGGRAKGLLATGPAAK